MQGEWELEKESIKTAYDQRFEDLKLKNTESVN